MVSVERPLTRRRRRQIVALGSFALATAIARATLAQSADAISLHDALLYARDRNPDLLSAREGVDSARAQERIAREIPNPLLTATTNKIPTDGTSASGPAGNGLFDRSYDSTVAVAELVEVGGKRRSRRNAAREGSLQAAARLADAERVTALSVLRGYAAVALARSVSTIDRESADSFAKSARLSADREDAGDISAAERAQIEIAAARSAADADAAEIAYRSAIRSLEALLGLPASPARDFPDGLERLLLLLGPVPESGDDEAVFLTRPDLVALDAGVRKAESDLALQRAIRLPDPTLLAQYERQPPDQRNTLGVGVSIPIPLFHANGGEIAAAEVTLSAARRDRDTGRLRVRADLVATRETLRTAESRAARYRGELLPKAERVRGIVEFSYAQGGASLLELLEAERNANDIRLAAASADQELVGARADYLAARGTNLEPGGHS